jgi:hypothetical protein
LRYLLEQMLPLSSERFAYGRMSERLGPRCKTKQVNRTSIAKRLLAEFLR